MAYDYTPAGDTLPSNFPVDGGGGGGGGGGGTTNYNDLSNKPTLGGVQLQGAVTLAQIGAATSSRVNTVEATANQASSDASTALTKATQAASASSDAESSASVALSKAQTVETALDALSAKVATMPDTAITDAEIDEDWEE